MSRYLVSPRRLCRPFNLCCILLGVGGPATTELLAQTKVSLTKTVTFERPDIAWRGGSEVLLLPSGQYLLLGDCQLHLFDAHGKYLRQIGRKGRGPGEFSCPNGAALGRGDSVAVFDEGITNILSPTLAFGRRTLPERNVVRFPGAQRFAPQPDGSLIAESWSSYKVAGDNRKGNPVHRLAPDWSYSIAGYYRNSAADTLFMMPIAFSSHRGGGVWSATGNGSGDQRVRLFLFDQTGLAKQSFLYVPRWWENCEPTPRGAVQPPCSGIRALRELPNGNLLFLATISAPNWKRYPTQKISGGFEMNDLRTENTMVVVLDPSGKELMAQRVPHNVYAFIDDTHVVARTMDDDGNVILEIYAIFLE